MKLQKSTDFMYGMLSFDELIFAKVKFLPSEATLFIVASAIITVLHNAISPKAGWLFAIVLAAYYTITWVILAFVNGWRKRLAYDIAFARYGADAMFRGTTGWMALEEALPDGLLEEALAEPTTAARIEEEIAAYLVVTEAPRIRLQTRHDNGWPTPRGDTLQFQLDSAAALAARNIRQLLEEDKSLTE